MDIEAAGVKGACVSRTKVPPRGGGGEGDGEYWLVQGGFDSASSGGTGVRFPLAGGGGSGKGVPKATVGLMVICMVASLMGGRSFCVKRSIGGRNGEWWAVSCRLEGSPARSLSERTSAVRRARLGRERKRLALERARLARERARLA